MKPFRCQICSETYLGDFAPDRCPFCGAAGSYLLSLLEYIEYGAVELSTSSREFCRQALELEAEDIAFYRRAARRSDHPVIAALLQAVGGQRQRHLEAVATCPELRAAYNAVQPGVSAFYSGIPLHEGLWRALRDYSAAGEASRLTGVRRRFLTKTMAEFRRHGADLDTSGKKELEAIDVELAELTMHFAENALDATNAFELVIEDASALAGLPESAIEAARESAAAKKRKGWRFTLQAPSYLAVVTYLDDARVREQLYRAHSTRAAGGKFDNTGKIQRILELRRARARLLGYRDFADLVLEDRMARSGERAQAFLSELRAKTEPHFRRENEELLAFRRELEGPGAPELEPWDVAYYAERLRQARLFASAVVDGVFELLPWVKPLIDPLGVAVRTGVLAADYRIPRIVAVLNLRSVHASS